MSAELYEAVSLTARYLFAFLGVLIALRAFLWIWADRAEKHRRLRQLPDSGMIGEMVVLEGSDELSEGTSLSVPWEGVLGSVRSCDVVVPCPGVRRHHLHFSFETGIGLVISPDSGCEAEVDGEALTCRSDGHARPMTHGSFLRVGSALLRLRVFSGLDSRAGFGSETAGGPDPDIPVPAAPDAFVPAAFSPVPGSSEKTPDPEALSPLPGPVIPEQYPDPEASEGAPERSDDAAPCCSPALSSPGSGRKRRSDRWEADWSE